MNNHATTCAENLEKIRKEKPLVHNITNFVVMNYTANALLALGASPVMAHSEDEVEEMVALAGALVLNIGTLTPKWVDSMIRAGRKANELGVPVVLDPVGSGATTLRTGSARRIIEQVEILVIRGNPSEILSLSNVDSKTKGVDAIHGVDDALETGTRLANELGAVLAITGAEDLVTDGRRVVRISNGHPLMGRITGTGCTATAIVGAFLAVDRDPVSAAAGALLCFGVAGEIAAQKTKAPGSMMINLIDALYTVSPQTIIDDARMKE